MDRLKLADIFCDGMVLQRGKKICIFGEGTGAGTAELNGKVTEFTADGAFRVYLPEEEAGGPYTLTVSCGGETVTLKDVLIGDVFLAGGQSNMEFPLLSTYEYRNELLDVPEIRYFQEPHQIDAERNTAYRNHGWMPFTHKYEAAFSAIAYFFALKYHRDTNVPVGIVSCNKGASRVDAWTAPEIVSEPAYQEMMRDHHEDMEIYKFNQGQWLYTNKLLPVVPYTLKGVLWYQGESNRRYEEARYYDRMFRIMAGHWRSLWEDELPFYTVQIMPFDEPAEKADWAEIRAAQMRAARDIPGVRLVTLFDTGEEKEIHPTKKKGVGEALAGAVFCDCGKPEEYSGPVNPVCTFEDDHISVRFDHADGLVLHGDVLTDTFLTVRAADGGTAVKPAVGEIIGNTLKLYTEEKEYPIEVRMGYQNVPRHNLYNTAGFLASPFREARA